MIPKERHWRERGERVPSWVSCSRNRSCSSQGAQMCPQRRAAADAPSRSSTQDASRSRTGTISFTCIQVSFLALSASASSCISTLSLSIHSLNPLGIEQTSTGWGPTMFASRASTWVTWSTPGFSESARIRW